jgi:hypothetical protein
MSSTLWADAFDLNYDVIYLNGAGNNKHTIPLLCFTINIPHP